MVEYNSSTRVMKLSERLFILNDRQTGLLTRLHFMKNVLTNPDLRPSFLPGGDKQFDSGWKLILRKFPHPDIKGNNSSLNAFNSFQKEILPQLSSFYFNLVDVLNLNDHISELLPLFSAAQIILDITTNHDLCKLYLDLLSNHFALMIFLTRIPEIKAIMALFNLYYEQTNGKTETSFPRMAERFTESLEGMIRSLQQEIQPYGQKLFFALNSLDEFFVHRTVRAKNWADGGFLNILADPESMSHTVLSDRLACELITYETLEKWIIFGYFMIAPELTDDDAFNRFKNAMKNSFVVSLFRDEVIFVHSLIPILFEGQSTAKIGNKKINELKESLNSACSQAPDIHADRRNYLKLALRNLYLVFADDPGLLGPKAFWAFWGISYATDEINWLLRHVANPPTKKNTSFNVTTKNLNERIVGLNLPEILFYIDELRNLVLRYSPIIQKFYIKLLKTYDTPGMSEMLREILPRLDIKEINIFNGILSQITSLADDQTQADFSSTRLDWLRLQTFLTSNISPINFNEYRRLFEHVHSTVFHTKLVDYIDELLKQTGNLSNFYFYQRQFKELSIDSCKQPSLMRFSIVFVNICGQLVSACHNMCPEERQLIGRDSIRLAKQLLNHLVENACNYILIRIDEFGELADQLSPHNSIGLLVEQKQMKKKKLATLKGKIQPSMTEAELMSNKKAISHTNLPGYESYKRNREEQTNFDKTFYSLTQLCATINHHKELHIFDQIITPREFLQTELQTRLIDILGKYTLLVSTNPGQAASGEKNDDFIITKPSDLLRRIHALVDVLVGLEQHVCIDIVSLFTTIFGQHTQPRDAFLGELTMTGHYAQWYCEVFLKHAHQDHFVWSPPMKSFVTTVTPDVVCFRAEDYTDYNELRALSQIIGPLGMRFICDQLIQDVGRRLEEMKKIVIQNRQVLESLRDKLEQPGKAKQIAASLQNIDIFNSLMKEMGVTLALKNLFMQSTYSVVKERAPYLMDTLKMVEANLFKRFGTILIPRPTQNDSNDHHVTQMDIDNLFSQLNDFLFFSNVSSTMGVPSSLDYTLCGIVNQSAANNAKIAAGQPQHDRSGELEYRIASLMVVMIATTFPKIMKTHPSPFRIDLDACSNNTHCISYAVNGILISMISMLKPGDSERASMEFLALSSSNMLRNCLEQTASSLLLELNQISNPGSGLNDPVNPSEQAATNRSIKYQDTLSIIFDMTLKQNPLLTANLQEIFFPYSLVRCAYHNLVKISKPSPFTSSIVNYTSMSGQNIPAQPQKTAS